MAKREQIKELEKEYETVSLILAPKGKSGTKIGPVLIKRLKALEEWHQKHHLPRKWRLSKDGNHLILE